MKITGVSVSSSEEEDSVLIFGHCPIGDVDVGIRVIFTHKDELDTVDMGTVEHVPINLDLPNTKVHLANEVTIKVRCKYATEILFANGERFRMLDFLNFLTLRVRPRHYCQKLGDYCPYSDSCRMTYSPLYRKARLWVEFHVLFVLLLEDPLKNLARRQGYPKSVVNHLKSTIDRLGKDGVLPKEFLDKVDELRKARNEFVHENAWRHFTEDRIAELILEILELGTGLIRMLQEKREPTGQNPQSSSGSP